MRAGERSTISPDAAVLQAGLLALSQDLHCALDPDGCVQYANAALAQALGGTPASLMGTPLVQHVMAADRERTLRCLEDARRTGRPTSWESRWDGPAGERVVAWRARPQPETGLVLAVGQDVTAARRSEEELHANQRLLRAVFDTIPHSLVVKDRDSNLLMGNAAWARRFGYRPEQLVGLNTLDIANRSETDLRRVMEADRALLAGPRDLVEGELERTATDGSPQTFHNWRSRLRDEAGNVIGLVSMSENITERRQAELALQASEQRYRTLVEGSIQGIVILQNNRAVFANESYAHIFGYEHAEDITALETVDPLVVPHERARQIEYGKARLRGEHRPSQYEFEGIRKDGSRIWLECLVRVVQWEGAPAVQATLRDITERKRAEQELRDSRRLLQTVFDTVPHVLFVKDVHSNYLMANAAWQHHYGYGPEAVVGRNTMDMDQRPLADREHVLARDRAVLEAGHLIVSEFERTVADGTRRMYRNFRAPLRNEAGEVVGIVGIAEDVTERQQAQDALRASQRLLKLVVDSLPHNVFLKDLQGRYVMANRAMALCHGLTPEQVVGRCLADLPGPTPEEAETLAATDRELLAGDGVMEWPDVPMTIVGGQKRIHRIQKVLLRGPEGEPQRILCISEDMTERRRAEQAARASQRLLRTVIDALPHYIHVKDRQQRFVLANRAMAQFHRLEPDQMAGLTIGDLPALQPAERQALEASDRQVLESGTMLEQPDVSITNAEGRTTYHHMYKLPLRDEAGNVEGVVGISEDISEQKRAAEELRTSQRLLRTVVDTVPSMITVKDLQRRYLMVNKSWVEHFRVPAEQALGHSLGELGIRSQQDYGAVDRMDDVILQGGQAYWEEPFARTLPDGSRQHFFTWRAPLHDAAGTVTGVVGAAMDVTPLKRVEEELRASRQLLQTVFDLIPLWVFVKDRERRLVMVNRRFAEDNGRDPEEAVRDRPFFLSPALTAEEMAAYEAMDRRVLEQEEPVELASMPSTLPNGETRRYRTIRMPLRDEHGAVAGIVGISEDVTERERVLQAIQQAQKLESLGVLAGGIAHDFNNLLVSVLGYAHLAATELAADSPVQPLVRQIETAGRRAGDLCSQMLAYAGKGSFQISQVRLNDLIREMTELIRVSLSRNIRLQFDFASDLPDVEVDATQLRQVVMNLIINASEAIGERPGAITMRTGVREVDGALPGQFVADPSLPSGPYVVLEVTDTGVGMDADTLQRIFDPFYTTKFSGRGLGLAAVLGIVRGHQGALRVTSTPGVGTTFTVLLPLATAGAAPEAVAQRPPAFSGGGTALVADDEPAIRELARLVLEPLGFQVRAVGDGAAALEAARELGDALRVVILDVTMPGLGSGEVLRRLQASGVQAPVIVMSGHAERDVRERLNGLPVSAFLTKPFTGADVVARLEQVLGREGSGE
ncbi:MAG TPA: PAS domain S-box protein [bacterium]|nr:PAS domain S-box protein [bacterium]